MDPEPTERISGATVRGDFNAPESVRHYARAVERVGLWNSERILIARHFTDLGAPLLEAGCGTGRVALALAAAGYADVTGFDFAHELLAPARAFAAARGLRGVTFLQADATNLAACPALLGRRFAGLLFPFNGLMQIPGREGRRAALRGLREVAAPGAPFLFTTHDREDEPGERRHWARQADLWARGKQDRSLLEFGDRYFTDDDGYRVFMHLPDRGEVLADLAATGWSHQWDEMRRRISVETKAVRDFSDECRFWLVRRT